jgi:predicted small metal-binding protein
MTYEADLKQVCGCGQWVQGASQNEVIESTKSHAKSAHGLDVVPDELVQKLMKAIRQV